MTVAIVLGLLGRRQDAALIYTLIDGVEAVYPGSAGVKRAIQTRAIARGLEERLAPLVEERTSESRSIT